MKKNLLKIVLLSFTLVLSKNIYSIEVMTEFVSKKNEANLVFLLQNDSLAKNELNYILDLNKKEKYAKALEQALKLFNKAKKEGNVYLQQKVAYELGSIYSKTNRFLEALKYYKISSIKYKYFLETNQVNVSYNTLAQNLIKLGTSYQQIAISLENDLTERYIDSAKYYYEELENIPTINSEIEKYKASAFNNLSGIYETDSIYDKAEFYILKALSIRRKLNNPLKIASSLNNLGNIYLSQKQYTKSKKNYLEAIRLIENDNSSEAIKAKASLYFNMAWAMRNLEDYKAYDYQEQSYIFLDTIRNKEFRGILDEIKYKHNFDSKKQLLIEQEENKRLKDQQAFITIGIIALVIIFSLVYFLNNFKLKQKNLALELEQTELLKNKELDKLKSETKSRIINATIDGEESERKKIAETLHDSVSALLSSASLHLQATRKQFNGSTPVEIDKTEQIISEATDKIRDLSHNLLSSVLLKFGLKYAIKDIAEKYSNSSITIKTEISNIKRYHQNFEIKVYNIIHEFVNNILKHSKASEATIKLKQEKDKLVLTISDNGIGFDKTLIDGKDGLGLNQIDARIQMMNGNFYIDSEIKKGTNIFIKLPVMEKDKSSFAFLAQ